MKVRLCALLSSLWLVACSSDVDLSVTFDEIKIINEDALVTFNGESIGAVEDVSQNNNRTTVDFSLDQEKVEALSLHSNLAASVEGGSDKSLVLYLGPNKEEQELKDDQNVVALNNTIDVLSFTSSGAMESFNDVLKSTAGALSNFLHGNELEELESKFSEIVEGTVKQSEDSLQSMSDELTVLLENLDKSSGDILNNAETYIDQLNDEIQVLEEKGKQESAKYLESLKEALEKHQNKVPSFNDGDKKEPSASELF